MRILIVEDSELLHKMYDLTLSKYRNAGATIIHAFNGREGLGRLNYLARVDIIILDINMPVMSGLEFLNAMMATPALRDNPVLIVSSEGSEEDTIRGLKAGAKAYVTKPFSGAQLCAMIDKIVAGQASASAPQVSPAKTPASGTRG